MISIKRLINDESLIYSVVIKFVQMAGGLLLVKILASGLSKSEFGYYSLIMAILGLITTVPFSALNQGVLRFTVEFKDKLSYFFTNIFIVYMIFILIYAFIIFFVLAVFDFSNKWSSYIFLLPFLLFSTVIFNFLTLFENALMNQKYFALMLTIDLTIKSIGVLFFKFYTYLSAEIVFLVYIISSIFIFFSYIYFSKKLSIILISLVEAKTIFYEMIDYIYPIMIWSTFIWAQSMVYRWYLGAFTDMEDVATFSIISALAILPVTSITGILGTYLLPKLFHAGSINTENIYKQVFKVVFFMVTFMIIVLFLILIFKEDIVSILTDVKYIDGAWMLPYMFSAMIVYSTGNVLSYIIYTKKKTKDLLLSNTIPGIFTIVVGYFLIKYYGLEGAFFTFIGSYVFTGIFNSYSVIKNNTIINNL